jgi:hypothetical protein
MHEMDRRASPACAGVAAKARDQASDRPVGAVIMVLQQGDLMLYSLPMREYAGL